MPDEAFTPRARDAFHPAFAVREPVWFTESRFVSCGSRTQQVRADACGEVGGRVAVSPQWTTTIHVKRKLPLRLDCEIASTPEVDPMDTVAEFCVEFESPFMIPTK